MSEMAECPIGIDYRISSLIKRFLFDPQSKTAVSNEVVLNASRFEALKSLVDFFSNELPPIVDCVYSTILENDPAKAEEFALSVLTIDNSVKRLGRFFAGNTIEKSFYCPSQVPALKRFWFLFGFDWSGSKGVVIDARELQAAKKLVKFMPKLAKQIAQLSCKTQFQIYADEIEAASRLLNKPVLKACLLSKFFEEIRTGNHQD